METMRAILFRKLGPPSVLELVKDHPKPERKPGELLIEIYSTSVNPIDWKARGGHLPTPGNYMIAKPKIPGGDLAGRVVACDDESKFKVGDRVFAFTLHGYPNDKWGTYAEYATAPETGTSILPAKLSFVEGAGIPITALTAWQAMDADNLKPGDRVLIHAGSGGVGAHGIQIAKAKGAFVATTCSSRNIDFVTKELGADVAVDYSKEKFEEIFKNEPFDVVVDSIGGDVSAKSYGVTKKSGRFRMLTGFGGLIFFLNGSVRSLIGTGPSFGLHIAHTDARKLSEIASLAESGKFKAVTDQVFPLEKAAEAQEYSEKGHVRGKIIIQVKEE